MCRVLQVSSSGYYAWQRRQTDQKLNKDAKLLEKIIQIFFYHKGRYGVPRVYKELRKQGIMCNKKRVERLMKSQGLKAWSKVKFKGTTNSKHKYPVAPNLLERYFQASYPNQVWTGDITYIRTVEGWLYLAVVIDLYSRKIVGWAMSKRIGSKLVIDALRMAIANRDPQPGLIFHSDRGVQYAAHLFQKIVKNYGFVQSMSRKGDCWDNAPTESFFASLKKELIRGKLYNTRENAMNAIFQYIEGYYNGIRLHSFLDYNSPVEFEKITP